MKSILNSVPVDIDINDILTSFYNEYDYDELIGIIKILDLKCADWEFTLKLFEYVLSQIDEYLSLDDINLDNDENIEDIKKISEKMKNIKINIIK